MVKPKRKLGRPYAGGRDPLTSVRIPPETTALIDAWAKKAGIPTRSEAIRQLVALGLKIKPEKKKRPAVKAS